jgi:hypothetical protein
MTVTVATKASALRTPANARNGDFTTTIEKHCDETFVEGAQGFESSTFTFSGFAKSLGSNSICP